MRFTIEIYTTANDGSEKLLTVKWSRRSIPLWLAKKRATCLRHGRKNEAYSARVLNGRGETLYSE